METKKHILVVDDEADLAELVRYNLQKEGYAVETAGSGAEAFRLIRSKAYHLIVLDLMLPDIQGTELCRMLRQDERTRQLPVIMLTAKGEDKDKIEGLELGADDYITKPFSTRELMARVKAVLRRTDTPPPAAGPTAITIGDLEITPGTYSVTKAGRPLGLSATEFHLLMYLAGHRGRIFTRDQLLDAAWQGDAHVEPRTVDVHIRRLRTHIEDDPANPVYIKTRRGIGYYFEAEAL